MQPDQQNDNLQNSVNSIQPYVASDVDPNAGVAPLQQQANLPIEDYDQEDGDFGGGGLFDRFRNSNRIFIFIIIGFVALGLVVFGILLFQASSTPTTPTTNIGNGNTNNGGTTGNNTDTDTDTDPDTADAVFIQMWGMFLGEEVMQPLINTYELNNPNVSIDYANKRPTGSRDSAISLYQDELNRVINSGDAAQQPDIFMVHNTWVGDYEGYTVPSSTYSLASFESTFYPAAVTDFASSGQPYGVPLWMDSMAIVYNRQMLNAEAFTEPPAQWTEFKNLATTLSTDGVSGFAAGESSNAEFMENLFWLLMLQNGVNLTNADGTYIFANQPEAVDALQFLQSFESDDIWNAANDNASLAFLNEQVAMIAVPSWRLRDILNANDDFELGLNIGVAPMPQVTGQDEALYAWADYWGAMVNESRPNSTEAWAFLEWLTEPEQLQELSSNIETEYGQFGIVYPVSSLGTENATSDYLSVYQDAVEVADSVYIVKGLETEDEIESIIDSGSATSSGLQSLQEDLEELKLLRGQL